MPSPIKAIFNHLILLLSSSGGNIRCGRLGVARCVRRWSSLRFQRRPDITRCGRRKSGVGSWWRPMWVSKHHTMWTELHQFPFPHHTRYYTPGSTSVFIQSSNLVCYLTPIVLLVLKY
ncbi:hypothetical protein ACQJBY_001445 [Aegilops geniculata]